MISSNIQPSPLLGQCSFEYFATIIRYYWKSSQELFTESVEALFRKSHYSLHAMSFELIFQT